MKVMKRVSHASRFFPVLSGVILVFMFPVFRGTCAEFEIPDRFSAAGYSEFRSSVAVINANPLAPYSLTVGTGANYNFAISSGGNAQFNGNIYRGTYTVLDSSMFDSSGSMKAAGIQNPWTTAGISVSAATGDRELDYMEYAADFLAQAAYVSNGTTGAADQTQTASDTYEWLGDGSGDEYGVYQSFQLQEKKTVTGVALKRYGIVGSPAGNWTVRIETNNGGVPSGMLADANASVSDSAPSLDGDVKTYSFAKPFSLEKDTTYHIVLRVDAQSTNNHWNIAIQNTNPYVLGNEGVIMNGSPNPVPGSDLYFTVYTQGLQVYSESANKTQGSYSLKGVAAPPGSIALDEVSYGSQQIATTLTWQHTCLGPNRILFVTTLSSLGGSDTIIGVTYNGVAMTKVTGIQCPSDRWMAVWCLISPAAGTHDIVVSNSANDYIGGRAVSYSGARQSGVPDASTANSATSAASISVTLTSVSDNCWLLFYALADNPSSVSGMTQRHSDRVWDTNGPVAAGSHTYTSAVRNVGGKAAILVAFAPAVPGARTLTHAVIPEIDLSGRTHINFDIRSSRTGKNIKIGLQNSGVTTADTTPDIVVSDTWQTVNWDISGVSDTRKDAISGIVVTIASAPVGATFYMDNMYAPGGAGNSSITLASGGERMRIDSSGNVGVGTAVPAAKLQVNGEIMVGNSGAACAGPTAGSIRYNPASYALEFCDGANWLVVKQGSGPFICGASAVSDVEGSNYSTVIIGDQCWMGENMRTTKYPNGNSIPKGPAAQGAAGWNTDSGYYSCPPNSGNTGEDCAAAGGTEKLGMLYQWSAVMNGSISENSQGICPTGWHIPTDAEWCTLTRYVDSTVDCGVSDWSGTDAGPKLKQGGSSGFNGLLAGYRDIDGNYYARGGHADIWSSSQVSGAAAWTRRLYSTEDRVLRYAYQKASGFSVRCIKD